LALLTILSITGSYASKGLETMFLEHKVVTNNQGLKIGDDAPKFVVVSITKSRKCKRGVLRNNIYFNIVHFGNTLIKINRFSRLFLKNLLKSIFKNTRGIMAFY
jgi:hypothetical protein